MATGRAGQPEEPEEEEEPGGATATMGRGMSSCAGLVVPPPPLPRVRNTDVTSSSTSVGTVVMWRCGSVSGPLIFATCATSLGPISNLTLRRRRVTHARALSRLTIHRTERSFAWDAASAEALPIRRFCFVLGGRGKSQRVKKIKIDATRRAHQSREHSAYLQNGTSTTRTIGILLTMMMMRRRRRSVSEFTLDYFFYNHAATQHNRLLKLSCGK